MVILQSLTDMSEEERANMQYNLYRAGQAGLMLLPYNIQLVAITDGACSNIKIISKDDDL